MSEKVEIPIQESDDQDQSEDRTPKAENDTEVPPVSDDSAVEEPDDAAKLETAERQAQENYDRLLRLSAEFDNYKKRSTRETQELVKYANENLFKELLNIVDNLERAIESAGQESEADGPLMQGIQLTLGEVMKILERHKVEPVDALGQPFDPAYHQAMMQEASTDQPANTVIREMQKGYVMHDRLLRPAMVVVAKAVEESENGQRDADNN